ncbi:MAG: DUF1624 domain-containing protein [Ruminococcus sp.]|nr:DUF1624 domain-containing protein [Ruminococcus sp.]
MKKDYSYRYELIDAFRGFALVNMAIYHFCYDIFAVYGLDPVWFTYPLVIVWERFICISFILISGVSLHFSYHPIRRGLIINLCGLLITFVTALVMPEQAVWFGVLNLIGCAMLIATLLRKLLDKINPFVGAFLSLLCFAVFYGVPERYIGFFNIKLLSVPDFFYQFKYVAFLGFPDSGFRSSDYFPIITWIFIFLLGFFLWGIVKRYRREELFRRGFAPLNFLGRHALIIYLIHQPILMGICFLIFRY